MLIGSGLFLLLFGYKRSRPLSVAVMLRSQKRLRVHIYLSVMFDSTNKEFNSFLPLLIGTKALKLLEEENWLVSFDGFGTEVKLEFTC